MKIKSDNSVRPFILEAILKHLNLPNTSIFEQNNVLNQKYLQSLEDLISLWKDDEDLEPKVLCLMAKGLQLIGNYKSGDFNT